MSEKQKPRTYIIGPVEGYAGEIPVFTFDNLAPDRNISADEIQTGDAELSLDTDELSGKTSTEESETQ
ncbi:MAG: hypothetical protein NUV98_00400 [Candidatus Roizmanbacteria bacterium]|nr:hypothetical protein [Candidatus Roizmanbacteria bacterium]